MPGGSTVRCPECAPGVTLMPGDGKCPQCFGSGTNIRLNSPEPKCANCKGTGVCPTCGGAGSIPRERLESSAFGTNRGRLRLALVSGVVLFLLGTAYCGYAQRKYVPLASAATNIFHQRFAAAQ